MGTFYLYPHQRYIFTALLVDCNLPKNGKTLQTILLEIFQDNFPF